MEPEADPRAAVTHTVRDGVARVVLCHPARRNALTAEMWRHLPPLLGRLSADPAVRVLVLTGHGDTFCAGADIRDLRAGDAPQDLAVAAEEAVAAFPGPSLAVIRGDCVGGGCQLAAACDLRLAAEGARFGVTPARLGLVYPASSTARLTRLIGPSAAKHLLFSAELIDTDRALRVGLVDEVLPPDALDRRAGELIRTLVSRSALTQRAAKEFVDHPPGDPEEAGRRTERWRVVQRESGEAAEGVAAFLERRPPAFRWVGGIDTVEHAPGVRVPPPG
ncbi:enoyl-CoA hydratase/isomerase family protein [Streptomyces calidiresistens]|uniref:Enoyl-CoA hydratase/isomerase family protein n=1 Tax=Streptomyces calidiresistens TaxID=1485586 RepID=A0A7W3T3C6_9ACTN|nr:enoyl-CoA hydratase/isomerase family protein [Streptomyces calidiresistens]MBB0230177.1 enoyl-CoA hydratase/isomerase family protein [Streptomyces calidiresistens]